MVKQFILPKDDKIKTLYVINPKSGRSKGEQIFYDIKPYINNEYITLVTKEKNEAYDILSNIYLDNIDKIIGIGGDGTIKEIIEGIKNNKNINNINVGNIPAGTGNGLAASILYSNGYKYNVMNSLIPINSKSVGKIDVAEVITEKNKYHSFLSFSLGFISDLDINTEVLRWMGSFRYFIGAIVGLLNMKTYSAKIQYKKDESYKWEELEDNFLMILACNLSHISYNFCISDSIKFDDGYHHLVIIKDDIKRLELLQLLLNDKDNNILNHPKITYIKTKEYKVNVLDKNTTVTIDGEKVNDNNFHIKVNNKDMNILK